LFGPFLDSLNQPVDDGLPNPRSQTHSDPLFTRRNGRRHDRPHYKALFQEVGGECMRSRCEKPDDWSWRFSVEMGEGMWEWFSRVSFGISEDMSRSVCDDGIEKVVELLDA